MLTCQGLLQTSGCRLGNGLQAFRHAEHALSIQGDVGVPTSSEVQSLLAWLKLLDIRATRLGPFAMASLSVSKVCTLMIVFSARAPVFRPFAMLNTLSTIEDVVVPTSSLMGSMEAWHVACWTCAGSLKAHAVADMLTVRAADFVTR